MPGKLLNLIAGPEQQSELAGWGLLWLRVTAGAMMLFGHGWAKLSSYGTMSSQFPDPLGIGSAASLALAVFAEFFCAAALILGLATRLVAIPLIVTMLVAALVFHSDDPWGTKELAMLYVVPFVTLLIAGPGRLAVDGLLRRR